MKRPESILFSAVVVSACLFIGLAICAAITVVEAIQHNHP